MEQKNNATLKFLQNKYHRNNSLNERLLLTLKKQAKSHAQSPMSRDSAPLSGFLNICSTNPDQENYRRNSHISQSTHSLKGRLAGLQELSTRNNYKAGGGTTLCSNISQGGNSEQRLEISPLFRNKKDSIALISEATSNVGYQQSMSSSALPEKSLQFDSTNIFTQPIAEQRSTKLRPKNKNPLRFASERQSVDLCQIQMEEPANRNSVFGQRNYSSDALKLGKVKKDKNLFLSKKFKDSSKKYTDFSKITETKSKAYLQQQVAQALKLQELAKIKAQALQECKHADDIEITMLNSKVPSSPILPFQNLSNVKSENCLTTVDSKPRIKVARHKIRFKTQINPVAQKQGSNFLSRLMQESVAEVERKKSHKMTIMTSKTPIEKSICPPPSLESNKSINPCVLNVKSIPQKFKNKTMKKKRQSLLDEVDQEELFLELN